MIRRARASVSMSVDPARSTGSSATVALMVAPSTWAGDRRISPRMFRMAVIACTSRPISRSASVSVELAGFG
jgi:hypothetical protein